MIPASKTDEFPSDSGSGRATLLAAGVIAAAALAAYSNSFQGPLIFDDPGSISQNQSIRHLWPIWSALMPPGGGVPVSGRPLLNLSFAINYALGGTNVWGYHAVNLLIHILAGLTLFGIMRRTLEKCHSLAFAVALIWTLHPLQTESVTYISQRGESLMGLFYLLMLYCFIRSVNVDAASRRVRFQVFSLAACLFGMATKEVMVSAPVMVLLYDRTFVSGSFRQAWLSRWRFYLGLGCTWILLAVLVAGAGGRGGTAGFGGPVPWWVYGATEIRAVAHYLRLSVWPSPLVFYYGPTLSRPAAVDVAVVGLLLAGTVYLLFRPLRKDPGDVGARALGFAGAFFFAILAPSSSVIPLPMETIAEHRMYLSLAAVVVVVVWGIYALIGRLPGCSRMPASLAACLALAAVCGVLTFQRNEVYRGDLALWRDTIEKMPENSVAHNNLGYDLLQEGNVPAAIAQCQEALRLDPDNAKAHSDLADALMQAGRESEAMRHYEEALRLTPNDAETHNNIALVLARSGRLREAISHYQEAIRLKPYLPEIHNNLGVALAGDGRLAEAIAEYDRALRLRPDYAEAERNLGDALAAAGRLPEAVRDYRDALRLQPDNPGLHNNLGIALAQLGRTSDARREFEEALRLKPDDAEARSNLARLPAP